MTGVTYQRDRAYIYLLRRLPCLTAWEEQQRRLFAVHADDWQMAMLKALARLGQIFELVIAVGTRARRDLLLIDAQAIAHVASRESLHGCSNRAVHLKGQWLLPPVTGKVLGQTRASPLLAVSGRFYTLPESAHFDDRGLWSHEAVWFSHHRTLLATVEIFVKQVSPGLLCP